MTREEYEAKYETNTRYTGYGLDTCTIMPCPGCAEPDFCKMPVLNPSQELAEGPVCKVCGRGFKVLMSQESLYSKKFEIVQTCGPDLPDYLQWIRRVS